MSILRTRRPTCRQPHDHWPDEVVLHLPADADGQADTRGRHVVACTTCETLLSRVIDVDSLEVMLVTWWLRRTCPRRRADSRRPAGPAPAARQGQWFEQPLTTMRAAG